jgi:hypothetical protein
MDHGVCGGSQEPTRNPSPLRRHGLGSGARYFFVYVISMVVCPATFMVITRFPSSG